MNPTIEQQPPIIPTISIDSLPTPTPEIAFDDSYAKSLVLDQFNQYENFRTMNHDRRWSVHDSLYFGNVPQKRWAGTNVPRASLGYPMTFDHIETALPVITSSVFGPSTDWFGCEAEPGATTEEARQIAQRLKYNLDHSNTESGMTARQEFKFALRQILQYGNGGVEIFYDGAEKRSAVQWIDIRDLYVDSDCPSPSIDESQSVIHRKFMTVDTLDGMRSDPRMHIPDIPILRGMANRPTFAAADQTKRNTELSRGVGYFPQQYQQVLPSKRGIEVLRYFTRGRIIWLLDRQVVAYNGPNPYGFIPFAFAPCLPVPGRFYGWSMGDMLQENQAYAQALINGRLDEISLALHPPRAKQRGMGLTPAQQAYQPGLTIETEDPKNAVMEMRPQNITQDVAAEIAQLDIRSEKRTGVNSTLMGIPRPGNANRTAGGMASQTQGGTLRMSEIVENFEDFVIVPVLNKMYRMEQYHGTSQQQLLALGPQQQVIQVGAQAFKAPVRFTMQASSRMLTKEKLGQVIPFLTQFMLQGPLLQQLMRTGKTIDWNEYFKMVQDATGIGETYTLMRDMTQQEQQMLNQPSPDAQMAQQQADKANQVRLQVMQMKQQGDMQKSQADAAAQAEQRDHQASLEMTKQLIQQQNIRHQTAAKSAENQHDRMAQALLQQHKAQADAGNQHQQNLAAAVMQAHSQQHDSSQQSKQQYVEAQMKQSEHVMNLLKAIIPATIAAKQQKASNS